MFGPTLLTFYFANWRCKETFNCATKECQHRDSEHAISNDQLQNRTTEFPFSGSILSFSHWEWERVAGTGYCLTIKAPKAKLSRSDTPALRRPLPLCEVGQVRHATRVQLFFFFFSFLFFFALNMRSSCAAYNTEISRFLAGCNCISGVCVCLRELWQARERVLEQLLSLCFYAHWGFLFAITLRMWRDVFCQSWAWACASERAGCATVRLLDKETRQSCCPPDVAAAAALPLPLLFTSNICKVGQHFSAVFVAAAAAANWPIFVLFCFVPFCNLSSNP